MFTLQCSICILEVLGEAIYGLRVNYGTLFPTYTFASLNFRSLELSYPGTFALNTKCSYLLDKLSTVCRYWLFT